MKSLATTSRTWDRGHPELQPLGSAEISGKFSLATICCLACCAAPIAAMAAGSYEYAAGEVTLPFAYSATVSSAPRPAGFDFKEIRHPDNCQALVRMDGEL